MINYIFDVVESQLKSSGIFQYIGHDYGQLTLFSRPPVRFPVAIYDVTQVDYTNLSLSSQTGTALISIKIAHKAVNRSSQSSIVEHSRDVFEFIEQANKLIHSKGTKYLTPLTRTSMRKLTLADDMVGYELTYRCTFNDDGAAPTFTAVETDSATISF
ncbi:MAG: hypothetical protein SNG45_07815 [Rikenellaceae bacterium]